MSQENKNPFKPTLTPLYILPSIPIPKDTKTDSKAIQAYCDSKKLFEPFKSADDIQKFLTALETGDLNVLKKNYSALNYLSINKLLDGPFHPICLLNRKFNQTGDEQYKNILTFFYNMYKRDAKDFIRTLDENRTSYRDDGTFALLSIYVACRQEQRLWSAGYKIGDDRLSVFLRWMMAVAIAAGNLDFCKKLLNKGYDISISLTDDDETPLDLAVKFGQDEIAQLFKQHPKPNSSTSAILLTLPAAPASTTTTSETSTTTSTTQIPMLTHWPSIQFPYGSNSIVTKEIEIEITESSESTFHITPS